MTRCQNYGVKQPDLTVWVRTYFIFLIVKLYFCTKGQDWCVICLYNNHYPNNWAACIKNSASTAHIHHRCAFVFRKPGALQRRHASASSPWLWWTIIRQPDSFLLLIAGRGVNYSMLYCYRSMASKNAVWILNAQQLRNSTFIKNLVHHKWNELGM